LIHASKIIGSALFALLAAVLGVILIFLNYDFGRYIVYLSIPIGVVATFIGSFAATLGKLDQDK
jgi:hypothetical protein